MSVYKVERCPECRYKHQRPKPGKAENCPKCEHKMKLSSNWYVSWWDNKAKKTMRKAVGPHRDMAVKEEARIKLGQSERRGAGDEYTLEQYSLQWLDMILSTRKPSTHADYYATLKNYIWPVFGRQKLWSIERAEIKRLLLQRLETYKCKNRDVKRKKCKWSGKEQEADNGACPLCSAEIKRELSDSTVHHIYKVMRALYNDARETLDPTRQNPAEQLGRLISLKKHKDDIDPYTKDEQAKLLSICYQLYPSWYVFFLTAFRTGVRISELITLKPDDLDFKAREINVCRNISKGRTEAKSYIKITTPKSGKGRTVHMSRQLASTLKGHLIQAKKDILANGWRDEPGFLFYNSDGNMIDDSRIRKVYKNICKKSGVRYRKFHEIRATFVARLLENNVSLEFIRDQVGHSSIQVTVDKYGKLIPDGNRDVIDSLDDKEITNIKFQ